MIGDTVKYRGKHGGAVLVVAILLSACGGGSSGSPPPVAATPVPPTSVELAKASRFASRATFGLPYAGIESIAQQGSHRKVVRRQWGLCFLQNRIDVEYSKLIAPDASLMDKINHNELG